MYCNILYSNIVTLVLQPQLHFRRSFSRKKNISFAFKSLLNRIEMQHTDIHLAK